MSELKIGPATLRLRQPQSIDGAALHALVKSCPPLDENSMYCNILQCTHFARTSVVADGNGELLGAITGFIVPERDDTLFIWQVAVSEAARGQSLGRRMLEHLLDRPACTDVRFIETTVTADNGASWAMFERFADRQGAALHRSTGFDKQAHFRGCHESEFLARIGPLRRHAAMPAGQAHKHHKEMHA